MLFLEELNRDMQEATEQHKKMESQLRRISEMESIFSRSFPQGSALFFQLTDNIIKPKANLSLKLKA